MDLRIEHYREVLPTLTGKRAEVYQNLVAFGPSTPCELAARMGWDKCSVRPRLTELVDMGRAQTTGDRREHQYVFEAVHVTEQLEPLSMEARG